MVCRSRLHYALSSQNDFTLVKLLVVIISISAVMAHLLRPTQSARQSSLRSACGTNFGQIGSPFWGVPTTLKDF